LNLIRVMPAKGQDAMATSLFLAKLMGPVVGCRRRVPPRESST
jgi:hypothetical protein